MATVTTVGKSTISVAADILGKVIPMGSFEYRVKKVPDPVATIASSKGGPINKNIVAAGTLIPLLENFDFEAKCDVISYEVTYLGKRQDPITTTNAGARFNSTTQD